MFTYPKKILSLSQQLQSYKDAGMVIASDDEVLAALSSIGYYRLRGYSFHLYDNAKKQYKTGTSFSDILKLYQFDTEMSHLLFSISSAIEVSLRTRLSESLLIHGEALAIYDPTYFDDKQLFWKNAGVLSNEVSRSSDVFIKHNFMNHDGWIPTWAAVEIMSFGNLSKTIKNLKTGNGSSAAALLSNYKYKSLKGNLVTPSMQMFSSWTHAVTTLRNMCAHNSRIYNRTISTKIQIPQVDMLPQQPKNSGLYEVIVAMKCLRPNDKIWNQFVNDIEILFSKYKGAFQLSRINFPTDWKQRLTV